MLLVGSVLTVSLLGSGLFTVALGVWHLGVPRWFAFDRALRPADTDLGVAAVGRWTYRRRVADVEGLSWVMSNAASYGLVSIGIVDIAWALGRLELPAIVGAWISGWWIVRAVGQQAIGRRRIDLALAAAFLVLAAIHVAVVVGPAG